MDDAIEFDAPARAEYVSLVRMLVASLAVAQRQVDEELVDNIKLALSEACTLVVEASAGTGRFCLRWRWDDEALVVDVSGPGAADERAAVPFQIIRALVDKVEVLDPGTLRMRILVPAL